MTRTASVLGITRPADGNYKLPYEAISQVYDALFCEDYDVELEESDRKAFLELVWKSVNEAHTFPLSNLPVISMVDGWARPLEDIILDIIDRLRRAPAAEAMKMAAHILRYREDDEDEPILWPSDLLRRVCDAKIIIEHEVEPPAKGALPVEMPSSSEGTIADIRAKREALLLRKEEDDEAERHSSAIGADTILTDDPGLLKKVSPTVATRLQSKARSLANLWANGAQGANVCILAALVHATLGDYNDEAGA